MVTGSVLLFAAFFAVFMASTALRPPHNDRHPLRRPPWLFAMLTAELIPLHVVGIGLVVAVAWLSGGLGTLQGRVALILLAPASVMYVILATRAFEAHRAMRSVLTSAGMDLPSRRIRWRDQVIGWPYRVPTDIERTEDISYAPNGALDIYRSSSHEGTAPALLQIHGGSWKGGNRRQQARPLLHHLARQGWVCVAVSYPLVPEATFPEQLVALKRAIAWMRTHGDSYGIDASRIAATGGSSGAHLAALLALTANDPGYQPGFAGVDTSVQAVVPMYGIFDLLNRQKTRDDFDVIPDALMKSRPQDDEDRYRAASPLDQVSSDAPPFLVIHGAADSLVSPAESELFVRALRAVSRRPVLHAEIPGATHAFDVIPSVRTQLVANGIATFLEEVMAPSLEQEQA